MIRINLAPQIDNQSSRSTFYRDVLILLSLCVFVHYGTDYFAQTNYEPEQAGLESKITELKNEKESVKKEIERAKELQKKYETAKNRSERIKQLGEERKSAVMLLDHLQIRHPERMWFTKLSYSSKTQSVQLHGYALDHTVIADYIKRLKEIGKIDSSDSQELREFVPQQLLASEPKMLSTTRQIKSEPQSLEQISLKQLISSEEFQGVTLQKFEINIKIKSG
jgi:Tfp pilus assembly protein PilN